MLVSFKTLMYSSDQGILKKAVISMAWKLVKCLQVTPKLIKWNKTNKNVFLSSERQKYLHSILKGGKSLIGIHFFACWKWIQRASWNLLVPMLNWIARKTTSQKEQQMEGAHFRVLVLQSNLHIHVAIKGSRWVGGCLEIVCSHWANYIFETGCINQSLICHALPA